MQRPVAWSPGSWTGPAAQSRLARPCPFYGVSCSGQHVCHISSAAIAMVHSGRCTTDNQLSSQRAAHMCVQGLSVRSYKRCMVPVEAACTFWTLSKSLLHSVSWSSSFWLPHIFRMPGVALAACIVCKTIHISSVFMSFRVINTQSNQLIATQQLEHNFRLAAKQLQGCLQHRRSCTTHTV